METESPSAAWFVPDRRYTALAGGGAVLAGLLVLVTADRPGRVLFGVAAVILLGYVCADLYFTPRLTADAHGLVIRSPLLRVALSWPQIEQVAADSRTRLGLRSTTLEVDAGAVFAVFSRRALGTDPVEAANQINAFRPR